MSISKDLKREIVNGREGKSGSIPLPYERVCDYIDIAKNTYYTIGGETGSGKSTVTQDMLVINIIFWYLKNKTPDLKLSIIGFFMERKMYMYSSRWLSRLIFQEKGIMIPPKKILGRKKNYKMSDEEYELVLQYCNVFDEWEKDDLLIVHEGSKNPSGISMYLEAFAKKHGAIHDKDKNDKSIENILAGRTYEPNHPNHIVLVIADHIGILAPEKEDTSKTKAKIDKFSRTMREARDIYGFSPVIIQQLNRNLADVTRQRLGDLAPKLSDFADSSQTQQDSDVILALFDPYRHSPPNDPGRDNGYDLKRLKDKWFRTYYRSLHILKNSFDSSGITFPMAIQPVLGILRTLPKHDEITESIYQEVMSSEYFLEQEIESDKIPFSGFGINKTHSK